MMTTVSVRLQDYQNALDASLWDALERFIFNGSETDEGLFNMLLYALGWSMEEKRFIFSGKRIRPMLLLLIHQGAGGRWQEALPAATAIELIHTFSLTHDDIQDQTPTRRTRPSVWKQWGLAHGINIGDALFALSFRVLTDLERYFPPSTVLSVQKRLLEACLKLTRGQFYDINGTTQRLVLDQNVLIHYFGMIEQKTAALLVAAADIATILLSIDEAQKKHFIDFARALGIAFQIQDDYLGLWGNEKETGKPVGQDLRDKKFTLPIAYAIHQDPNFYTRFLNMRETDIPDFMVMLENYGARTYVETLKKEWTEKALLALNKANPQKEAYEPLEWMTRQLCERNQ